MTEYQEAWEMRADHVLKFINFLRRKGMSVGEVKPDTTMQLIEDRELSRLLVEWLSNG